MCTAQYSACLRDPREETHILYSIKQRQDQSRPKGLESKWTVQHERQERSRFKEIAKKIWVNIIFWLKKAIEQQCQCPHNRCVVYCRCSSHHSASSCTVRLLLCGSYACGDTGFQHSCVLLFKIFFEMCEVWPASPVPWVSSGYLCVKIQCRCVKCGTFVLSDLIWQSWEKMVVTKQCWLVQMWTVLREPFCARASLISQLRVTVEPEVTPQCPCTNIHPFRGIGCTQWAGNKV